VAIIIVAGLFILTIGVLGAGIVFSRGGDSSTQQRLDQFVGGGSTRQQVDDEEGEHQPQSTTSALTDSLDRAIEERGLGRNLATELARADLKLTIAEFYAVTLISIIGSALVFWFIYSGFIFPLIGAFIGYFLPKFYIKTRQKRRLNAFNDQLGDAITLMANGLRAGYSMLQAMDAVAREMPEPMSKEFLRVVREIGLGISNERAYSNLLRRVPSDDLDLMITAINVQAEVGGNLAEILEIIGFVIRERVRIKGEIQVLTAQGQLSGYVISFLPIALGFILFAMNPDYIGRMVFTCEGRGLAADAPCSQPCGWIMVGIGLIIIASGFFAIQKIIDIDV